jgi:hypothetical protein
MCECWNSILWTPYTSTNICGRSKTSSVRAGLSDCPGSFSRLLKFRVMIEMRASFAGSTWAGTPG